MQVIILTEAGNHFGLGHLSRCVALKKHFIKANFSVEIYNRGDFESEDCINLDWLDLHNLNSIFKPIVIVDSYYAKYELCSYIATNAKVCIFLDDFSRMKYPRNAILYNGALNAERFYIEVENKMFLGIEYGLLRDEFLEYEGKEIRKDILKVLITLGGNDYANNTQKVLDIVSKELPHAEINVIIPNNHKPLHYGFDTNVHSNLSARLLKDLMLDCDLAISGGGVTMVELQSTRTPTIALEIAPNQQYQLREWQKVGLRVAKNTHQIEFLLKTLRRQKHRNKLYNQLSKINIGSGIGDFVQYVAECYNAKL